MITQGDLQGHWRREQLNTPGFQDGATRVNRLYCGSQFVDLRIPKDRPDIRGLACLAEFALPSVRSFLRAEGSAGQISAQDGIWTWHRAINWQGVPHHSEVGKLSFDASDALVQEGVQTDLREVWHKVPQRPFRAEKVRYGDMTGVLIENEEVFMLGVGPSPQGRVDNMLADMAAGRPDLRALHQLFESEYVLGHWDGPFGMARLSTNPFHEGQVALERKVGFTWHALAFDGVETARPLALG